jgi:nucleoside permease NupC
MSTLARIGADMLAVAAAMLVIALGVGIPARWVVGASLLVLLGSTVVVLLWVASAPRSAEERQPTEVLSVTDEMPW